MDHDSPWSIPINEYQDVLTMINYYMSYYELIINSHIKDYVVKTIIRHTPKSP